MSSPEGDVPASTPAETLPEAQAVEERPARPVLRPGELLLIRHAQSEANAGPCDACDCGLTELGRRQATRVGERLRSQFDVGAFWGLTSPYRRARETADPSRAGAGPAVP